MSTTKMTRYYFRFDGGNVNDAPIRIWGDKIEEDSAIAPNYKAAVKVMVNGYGERVVKKLVLIKEEPIELYKPDVKQARPSNMWVEFANENSDEAENEVV